MAGISRIRSTHAKPEMPVRKFLYAGGYRYTLHSKKLPAGQIRYCFAGIQNNCLIYGCFWHGQITCKYYVGPKTRTGWLLNKYKPTRTMIKKPSKP